MSKECKHKWREWERRDWTFDDKTDVMYVAQCKKCKAHKVVTYEDYCVFHITRDQTGYGRLNYTIRN